MMSRMSLGDMAQTFQLRRDNARLKADMMRLSGELSSGRKSDISSAVAGDYGPIAGLERQLGTLKAYKSVTTDATVFAGGMQLALERVHKLTDNLAPQLLTSSGSGNSTVPAGLVIDAAHAFSAAVVSFNSQSADRALFAGSATDTGALASADTMLAELRALTAGETTGAGVAAKLDAWFGPGGGFETTGYVGSTTDLEPFRVGEGTEVRVDVRADDPAIRETLKGLAMAALLEQGPLDGNEPARFELAREAGTRLLANQSAYAATQALVGSAEAAIERAVAQNVAEETALTISRNEITAVDPYQTAVQLQEIEVQLETLYAMTSRLSRLSLVDFLR